MRKAIIIGGGPTGLMAALRLQQATDISSTIYELRSEPKTHGGGALGIMPNGLRLFDRLGVLDELLALGNNSSMFTMRSLTSGTLGTRNMVEGISEINGGYGYLRIKRTDMIKVLMTAVSKANIPIRFEKKLVEIEELQDAIRVTFSDGTVDTADLLLGCDGIHSTVRKLYVDPSQTPAYTGVSALGSVIDLPKTVDASQLQGIHATLTTMGAIGISSCSADKRQVFWGVTKAVVLPSSGDWRDWWETNREEEVADFKKSVLDMSSGVEGGWASVVKTVVMETRAIQFFPIFKLPLERDWHKGRCLLMGDAAHAMPPQAGQGTSMALEDVFAITRLLADSARSLDAAFTRFEKIRRPRVAEIAKQADKNAIIREGSSEWGLWLKELVVWAHFSIAALLRIKVGRNMIRQVLYDIDEEKLEP